MTRPVADRPASEGANAIKSYGITRRTLSEDALSIHVEELDRLGYTIIDSGLDEAEIAAYSDALDALLAAQNEAGGGRARMEALGEADQVRAPLTQDERFLKLATHPAVLTVARRCIGDFIVLMQQNGIVNAPAPEPHHQTAWHRDLPYQHLTTSRAIAINALFCVDPFEAEMGATFVLPASHLREEFPSDAYVRGHELQVFAKPGSYIVINSMLYHRAGWNRSKAKRRAVNNVYTMPYIKQQIALPAALGGKWSDDRALARLLGYETDPPRSVAEFIDDRARKSGG